MVASSEGEPVAPGLAQSAPQLDGLPGLGHLVHPQQLHALVERMHRRGERGRQPLAGREAVMMIVAEPLAREAEQQRPAEAVNSASDRRIAMFSAPRLPKPMPGSTISRSAAMPAATAAAIRASRWSKTSSATSS